jgi:hypothetical protein
MQGFIFTMIPDGVSIKNYPFLISIKVNDRQFTVSITFLISVWVDHADTGAINCQKREENEIPRIYVMRLPHGFGTISISSDIKCLNMRRKGSHMFLLAKDDMLTHEMVGESIK